MPDHIHPLPVCGFGGRAHDDSCEEYGEDTEIACGTIVDLNSPFFGMALCRHRPKGASVSDEAEPGLPPDAALPDDAAPPTPMPPQPPQVGRPDEPVTGDDNLPSTPEESGDETEDEPRPPDIVPGPEPQADPRFEFPAILWWGIVIVLGAVFVGLLYWLWWLLKKFGIFSALASWIWALIKWLRDLIRPVSEPRTPELPETPDEPQQPDEPEQPEEPEDDEEWYEPSCEVIHFNVPHQPTGPSLQRITHRDLIEVYWTFRIEADFLNSERARCAWCQYRQWVRGYFRIKEPGGYWIPIPHPLTRQYVFTWQTPHLHPDGYEDDGYGYRARRRDDDFYDNLHQHDGCAYHGYDSPGLKVSPGTCVDIQLHFIGEIQELERLSVANKGVVKDFRHWTRSLRGRVVEEEAGRVRRPFNIFDGWLRPVNTRLKVIRDDDC